MRGFALIGFCPRCDGNLSVRYRKRDGAPFIGCNEYPDCRYTAPYEHALQEIASEIDALRRRVTDLQAKARAGTAPRGGAPKPEEIKKASKAIRDLIFRFHPDRNPGGLSATDVVAALNAARTELLR